LVRMPKSSDPRRKTDKTVALGNIPVTVSPF
jgi:hypothetical protein